MIECYCLQILNLDWVKFYARNLAVDGVILAVAGVVPAVDRVVPAVDLFYLIRVLVALAVEMIWAADMVIMVLQDTEVMEIQTTLVNTRIMMDKELGWEVLTLLGMGPLSLKEESPRLCCLRGYFLGENMSLLECYPTNRSFLRNCFSYEYFSVELLCLRI